MSRRSGKAASRKARQQRRARQALTSPAWAPPASDADAVTASGPTPAPARPALPPPGMGSRLGEAAQLEYHYVGRDLRNTAVLVLVMAVLLAGAVIVVNLAEIAPS